MTTEMTLSCPHCGRHYKMKIDPERLKRLKTRATCGRCGKTFDVASRVAAAASSSAEPVTEPKLPRVDVAPTPVTLPTAGLHVTMQPLSSPTLPDLNDEMEELAREFAEAAARFTPVGVKRPAGLEEATDPGIAAPALVDPTLESTRAPTEPLLPSEPATAEPQQAAEPQQPAAEPPQPAEPQQAVEPPLAVEPSLAPEPPQAPAAQFSLEAEPATADEELAAVVPTRSRAPVAPRSWLELADPGLASLQPPPSHGAAALEALLNEADTIALPPPSASS